MLYMEGEFDSSRFDRAQREKQCGAHIEYIRRILIEKSGEDIDPFTAQTIEDVIAAEIHAEGVDRAVVVAFSFMNDSVTPEYLLESIPDGFLLSMKKIIEEYERQNLLQ